jgi:acetolactate synthase-1/2/3 large subunit
MQTAAELLIKCLENEGVEFIFGIPGEENLHVMDTLRNSSIKFITVRHEQGSAFMADVYGRLTGKAGVCLATLGPGATNLITGYADANMDRAPIVAIAGQGSTTRMHKESHQMIDLVNLFAPISKYSTEILQPEIVPEIVRKAFKDAQSEKPGGAFISFPENIAAMEVPENLAPLKVQRATPPFPAPNKVTQAAEVISAAQFPIIMVGNGVIRANAHKALIDFVETLNIPVAHTFMAKGCVPFSHPLSLGTVGLQAHDYVSCGFDRADVVICIGFDMVEYHPASWNPQGDKKIIHIDQTYAEVDAYYQLEVGVLGEISRSLELIVEQATANESVYTGSLREVIEQQVDDYSDDNSFPIKPQRILYDTRQVLADEDILLSDVGAHKMWIARLFHCEQPNTCIISNGFASMGSALPGALAAKMAYPQKRLLAIT